jgi:hypothetical protein
VLCSDIVQCLADLCLMHLHSTCSLIHSDDSTFQYVVTHFVVCGDVQCLETHKLANINEESYSAVAILFINVYQSRPMANQYSVNDGGWRLGGWLVAGPQFG